MPKISNRNIKELLHLSKIRPSDAEMEADLQEVWQRVSKQTIYKTRIIKLVRRVAVAASLVGVLIVGYWLYNQPYNDDLQTYAEDTTTSKPKLIPDAVLLTLGNGQQIILDEETPELKGSPIYVDAEGQVRLADSYNFQDTSWSGAYHTLSTPAGVKKDFTLMDGTQVSLDAGSSITFPTHFSDKERLVRMTGQVYFKIAPKASHPFCVQVGEVSIRNIGTSFNVNAYTDEPIMRTTLIEGGIRVQKGTEQVTVKPGQQVAVTEGSQQLQVRTVDLEPVVAWRSHMFLFKDVDLKEAMREIARWYQIEIIYADTAPLDFKPGGWISKSQSLEQVLKTMSLTGAIHFEIVGNQVIVSR
jgi:transmembrane sensor